VRVLAAACTLIVAGLLVAGCGASGHTAAGASPSRPGMEPMFEAGKQVNSDPSGAMVTLRRLGVARVKVFLPWSAVAPNPTSRKAPHFDATDPGAYPPAGWARYDAIVRAAAQHRMGLDLTLSNPPVWAAGADAPDPVAHPMWKPSPQAFGEFVRAVGKRYSGSYKPPGAAGPLPRVSFWSIWNEPNYGADLAPQAVNHIEVSPALYRGLLDAAWSALQATGHGRDTVLIGELAPRGQTTGNHPGLFDGMVPLRFLRALYCVDASFQVLRGTAATERGCPASGTPADFRAAHPALFEAGGFADHPYAQGGIPPNSLAAEEPDYADRPALPKLESTLDRVQQIYGSNTRFRIYSTEFGYQTNPPEKMLRTTDPATAAIYLNWAEYLFWKDPRVASYDQYLLTDPPSGNFATGLEFADGTRKATYAAYRMPIYLPDTKLQKGRQAEVWGAVRPAPIARMDTGRDQHVKIQFRPASGGGYKTVQTVPLTDRYGYFDTHQAFDSSGTVRLAWSYPHGETIFSREVQVTVS
jgi:hypothetical protein